MITPLLPLTFPRGGDLGEGLFTDVILQALTVLIKNCEYNMAEKHFYEQRKFTESYLIPYFEKHLPDFRSMKILEIGCAEAGFMDVLSSKGFDIMGLELEEHRVKTALEKNPNLDIIVGDITQDSIVEKFGSTFDLIVMRDVIEHIPDRVATFSNVSKLLKRDGYLYITFPPRFSAFAGHHQNYRSLLKLFPYLQLLPNSLIRGLAGIFKEPSSITEQVILNSKVGLTIAKFEKYYQQFDFKPAVKELFLFRPIYGIRFKTKTRKFPNVPLVREFLALGCEYLLHKT